MKTSQLLFILLGLLAIFTASEKDIESSKPFRIAIIDVTPTLNSVFEKIKVGVYQKGCREGIDVEFIYDGPSTTSDAVIDKAREMVEKRVDLIVGRVFVP